MLSDEEFAARLARRPLISGETTIAELESILRARGVRSLRLQFTHFDYDGNPAPTRVDDARCTAHNGEVDTRASMSASRELHDALAVLLDGLPAEAAR